MWRNNNTIIIKKLNSLTNNIKRLITQQRTETKILDQQNDINNLKLNDKIHGFIVKVIKEIPDFRIRAVYLQHEKTKADYLHLYREDDDNLFSINFRTTPKDSTGSPHILEHTVLCGSKIFPVRDPFFKMLNRSLATFMNAMTGSDYTMYPFSTQNYSDYRNLQKIYLDAAFNPLLSEPDFMQEGWRLENENLEDAKSDIIIKGVVYNEMKGVFSENENIFSQKLQNFILPDHTYGTVSGGDPMEIPNLTWQGLKQFHKEHYHPSNCRCFSYGNFPLIPSLEYLNDEYLTKYAYSQPTNTVVPKQKRWLKPQNKHIYCRYEPMGEIFEKQNQIGISVLLSDCTDVYETFLMQFLSQLLIKGPNSAFYKSLIEPNFSSGFTPSTGLDTQTRDTVFTISLKGIKVEDFEKIETIFDKTIDQVIDNGFSEDHIEEVLHSFELSLKNETKNFGLNLLFGLAALWNHTDQILPALQVNSLMEKLRLEIKNNPNYLQNIVKKYFKENPHKLVLTMSPDKDFDFKLTRDENELIKQKTKNLTDKDKKNIYEKGLQLKKLQEAPQDTNKLPTLLMNDISSTIERVNKVNVTINHVPTQINKVNANGLVYFKSLLNTTDLSQEQQMLLPLFCYIINKMGTDKLNYKEYDSQINRKTAGLNFNIYIADSLYHLHTYEPSILLSSYCLEKNIDAMWELWSQLFNLTKLKDVERFKMLAQLYMANLTHGIADSGHIYAMQAAASLVSSSAYQVELLSGLQHISYMKRLMHTSNYKVMLEELVDIAKILFSKKKMRVALNICAETNSKTLRSYENFITTLPGANLQHETTDNNNFIIGKTWAASDSVNCQHHIMNIPVNYCSKSILTSPYTKTEHAALKVLAKWLSAKYLHPELREKRGAYGAGIRLTADGVFSFFSYRDPKTLDTLDVFDSSYEWIKSNLDNLNEQELTEAKLGVFQAVDSPIPPSSKGCEEFLRRLTPDTLQRHRAEIMSIDKKDLECVTDEFLANNNVAHWGKVIIGSKQEGIDLSNRNNEIWTVADNA